jgi:hypothetical protein
MPCARCGNPDSEMTAGAARAEPVRRSRSAEDRARRADDAPFGFLAQARRWCDACERDYDAWSRRHAADVVWEALAGMVIVVFAGMGLPLLGVSWVLAATGIFAGFGTIIGVHRLNARRRRRQYLRGGDMPRAYLTEKT